MLIAMLDSLHCLSITCILSHFCGWYGTLPFATVSRSITHLLSPSCLPTSAAITRRRSPSTSPQRQHRLQQECALDIVENWSQVHPRHEDAGAKIANRRLRQPQTQYQIRNLAALCADLPMWGYGKRPLDKMRYQSHKQFMGQGDENV